MSLLPWLNLEDSFPPIDHALSEPDGLLAAGGDLSSKRLLEAYSQGIFPWSSDDQPILWWCPDPRCVIFPDHVHISRSLKKQIRKHPYTVSFNQAFQQVMHHCARGEEEQGGWITEEMKHAYEDLHTQGFAHSVEVWMNEELIGGLYGVCIGKSFFGESMFSLAPNASKIAFAALCKQAERWKFQLIDCQIENEHLLSLGASLIARNEFMEAIQKQIQCAQDFDWVFEHDILDQVLGKG